MSQVTVHPLNPCIGAEIHGVDLRAALSPEDCKQVREAWLKHHVIFFRDQDLTLDEHKVFGAQFGELHVHPNVPSHADHPEILVIHADAKSERVAGHGWHSDVSFEKAPPCGSILRLTETPASGGGDTLFSNTYAAYEGLSDTWKNLLGGMSAAHESFHVHGRGYGNTKPAEDYPRAVHPIVRTHPETGRKGLFVNSAFTTHIKGMKPAESRATLDFLFRHMELPDFQCRFSWRPHSIAMWDNRCVQHFATWDYFPETRHGYRVALCGDVPV